MNAGFLILCSLAIRENMSMRVSLFFGRSQQKMPKCAIKLGVQCVLEEQVKGKIV